MIKKILLVALLGVVTADRFSAPSNSYSAPNGRPNGGNGNGLSNGYSAPNSQPNGGNGNGLSNGYSAPNGGQNGANGNSLPNGYSAPNGNGFNAGSNGGSNGYSNGRGNGNGRDNGNGPSSAYGAPRANELAELADILPGGGVPGEDFPVLSEVPDTGFQCGEQAVSGYYADVADEAGCQVFHICQLRESGLVQQDSFLCPNGTIFNQQYLVCDWWFNFDCSTAEDFYSVNELIGQDPNAAYGAQASSINGAYGAPAANGNGNGNRDGYSNSNGRNGNGGNGNGSGYTSPGATNGNGQNGGAYGGY